VVVGVRLLPAQFLDQLISIVAGQSAQASATPLESTVVSWSATNATVARSRNLDLACPAAPALHAVIMRRVGIDRQWVVERRQTVIKVTQLETTVDRRGPARGSVRLLRLGPDYQDRARSGLGLDAGNCQTTSIGITSGFFSTCCAYLRTTATMMPQVTAPRPRPAMAPARP
jgi:hypothetical protein